MKTQYFWVIGTKGFEAYYIQKVVLYVSNSRSFVAMMTAYIYIYIYYERPIRYYLIRIGIKLS
jgi:hypothetical protein